MRILDKSRKKNTVTDTKIPYQAFERLPMLPITPGQNKLVSVPERFAEVCISPDQPWEIFMWSEISHIEDVWRNNPVPGSHRFSERLWLELWPKGDGDHSHFSRTHAKPLHNGSFRIL
jgi:hypothetical protein